VHYRGKTATLIIADESDYFPPALNTQLTIPLMRVDGTALISATTPNSRNVAARALESIRYPDGTPLYICKTLALICAKCVEAGVTTVPCAHRVGRAAPWIDEEMDQMISEHMLSGEDATRELAGVLPGDMNTFFGRALSEQIGRREPVTGYEMSHQFILTMVDPAKERSEFAIVSLINYAESYRVRWSGAR